MLSVTQAFSTAARRPCNKSKRAATPRRFLCFFQPKSVTAYKIYQKIEQIGVEKFSPMIVKYPTFSRRYQSALKFSQFFSKNSVQIYQFNFHAIVFTT